MKKKAIVTGATGQDGSYLVELLLLKGYHVIATKRRSNSLGLDNLVNYFADEDLEMVNLDITDPHAVRSLIAEVEPAEFYNLAAQSHVRVSFDNPSVTFDVNAKAVLNILEAIRIESPSTKFYQASTSEMFGHVQEMPQTELTPFYPRSPYGVAKLAAHWMVVNYREAYGLFAASGILFNHESERRGEEFVTQKIARAVAMISLGKQGYVTLGNLDAKRDWGYAPEYVEAMWMMLQQDKAEDYVIATGKTYMVRDFVAAAFMQVGIEDWEPYVKIDPKFFRPTEVNVLLGDATKAKTFLGWHSRVSVNELAAKMVAHQLKILGGS